VIIFGSVRFLSKKVTKSNFFLKKKPKPGQTDRFRFCSVFQGKNRFNRFGSVFSVLACFFPVLARFGLVFFCFFVGFSSIWFGFLFIKLKPNRPAGFFKNLIGLIGFFSDRFFRIFFFPVFSV